MSGRKRRQHIAIWLMLGVTILAGATTREGGRASALRRFLAVDNASGRSVFTVVTDASTTLPRPELLTAGHQVRVYGVKSGRTIRARRIEIID
ncbi:hypothetical protein [Sulfobacillus harzensis]|uniref:DUF5666 domain-containing protein n=1 Tax=Sulfobacillus harzensis TaxID=2729629 RepID=A0A7Y0Q2B9_9FIRM|nr:hypothetical protein [Sulfobacillus harzensis]NMP22307.1 hypothetical protein [Sulfobacillus harzensis]